MKYIPLFAGILFVLLLTSFKNPAVFHQPPYNVYIGTNSTDTIFKMVSLANSRNKFATDFDDKSKQPGEGINYRFNLSEPKLLRLNSVRPMSIPVFVFVQPGDSVRFKMGNGHFLQFEGKNAAHYNFFQSLSGEQYNYPEYDAAKGIWKYKEGAGQVYKKRLTALKDYAAQYKVTDKFIKTVKAVLEYQYYGVLLNSFLVPIDEIKKNPTYLDGIDFGLFKREGQENNFQFYSALSGYLKIYSVVNESSEAYSADKLQFLLKAVENNLSGEIKQYAITEIISDYEKNLTPANIALFTATLQNSLKQVTEAHYKKALESIRDKMNKRGADLPNGLLKCKLTDIDGNSITLEDILKSKGNSIKVIDFWASWCQPCISGIKETYAIREKFTNEKNVHFLYFSTDKDVKKWKNRVAELAKIGVNKDHYLIPREAYALFNAYFSIESIPRYIILNSTNKTYVNSFPSPGSANFERVVEQIK